MKIKLIFFLFFILLIISCSNPNDPERSLILGDTITIYYQETLTNPEENISVKFDSLYENRCPSNAVCRHPGVAGILFNFFAGQKSLDFWLEIPGLNDLKLTDDTTTLGYTIALLDILPYPHTDSSYFAKDYSAEIVVSE